MNHYHYQSEFTSPAQLSEIQYGGFELSSSPEAREKLCRKGNFSAKPIIFLKKYSTGDY
jgi:hypothetical protein